MNLANIEAFVALAETGSVNRAAARLHITQPAMTRRVQNFESELGGSALLDRSVKPPTLTPAGRQALEHCRRVLKAVTELEATAAASGEPTGPFRIGIAHGLGEVVVGAPLDDLRNRFPGIRVQVSSDWTARLMQHVREGEVDCAVGLLTPDQPVPAHVLAIPVGLEEIVVVSARPAPTPSRGKGGIRLSDLSAHGWVLNPPGCGCRAALQRAFDRDAVPLNVAAEVFGEELQLSMIARGAGLGLVPRRQLNHSPQRAHLRAVPLSDFSLHPTITILTPPALGNLAPVVQRLQERITHGLRASLKRA